MEQSKLKEILDSHENWLNDNGGEKANLRWANLRWADLRGADLRWAALSGADLREADLRWADLRGADLREVDLRWADLRGADLRGAVGQVFITQRSDGHQFFAVYDKEKWMIRAGCRYWDIEIFREHTNSYACDKKRSETRLILDYAELVIAYRGIVPEGE